MMKNTKHIMVAITSSVCMLATGSAVADSVDTFAANSKPLLIAKKDGEKSSGHRSTNEMSREQEKYGSGDNDYGNKEKREKKYKEYDDDDKGSMERQREMKEEQERKELGKGAEQGQDSREEHSRKWWRFWDK